MNKTKCPVCHTEECSVEFFNNIENRVCENCGFMTTSEFKIDSNKIKEYEKTTAKIIKELRFIDKDLKQYWYPSIIFIPNKGAVMPIGNKEKYKWGVCKVVPIPIMERINYPIEGKPGQFYETRLAVEQTVEYDSFREAVNQFKSYI